MKQRTSFKERLLGVLILGGYAVFLGYAVLRMAGVSAVTVM